MKIGVIGATSGIAAKAYLPVYSKMQDKHDFLLYSRSIKNVEKVKKTYSFNEATTNLDHLNSCDLVTIHAATSHHYELAKHFIIAGIHVLVDKPLSENFDEAQSLQELAEKHNVLCVVGFNRRFAPLTDKLMKVPNKNLIRVHKNSISNPSDIKFKLYDLFIHPLDTLIYLLDDNIENFNSEVTLSSDKKLTQVVVTLRSKTCLGIASMNLMSGAATEEFTVESIHGTYRLSDLATLENFEGLNKKTIGINGWNPATYNRGFDNMIFSMVEAVKRFDSTNRLLLMNQMKQDNVLICHKIIDNILSELV